MLHNLAIFDHYFITMHYLQLFQLRSLCCICVPTGLHTLQGHTHCTCISSWLRTMSGAHLTTYVVPFHCPVLRMSDLEFLHAWTHWRYELCPSHVLTFNTLRFGERISTHIFFFIILDIPLCYIHIHTPNVFMNGYVQRTTHTVKRAHFMKTSNKPKDIASRTDLIDHTPSNVDNDYHLMLLYIYFLLV